MNKRKFLTIFGTRPEAIKLAPLILKKKEQFPFDILVCITGQHNEMLRQVLEFFKITPDYNINIMKYNQSLFDITIETLKGLEEILSNENPDLVIVQGDATSAFIGALASFYFKIPIAHVEAGLRSSNKYSPFPEEINRVLISHLADYHFSPTLKAKENLLKEGINPEKIFVVGNTVIDALYITLEIIKTQESYFSKNFQYINLERPLILVTCHRRESFGNPLIEICKALKEIAEWNNVEIVYPVHLNPNVRKIAIDILNGHPNIHLIPPLDYPHFIWLMKHSYFIITDSGGIQEEAPSLGKPILVVREVTERLEGMESGNCKVIGTNRTRIVEETKLLLEDHKEYEKMSKVNNPYGDGKASERILNILMNTI